MNVVGNGQKSVTLEDISTAFTFLFGCPCNYAPLDRWMVETFSADWFEKHCRPESKGFSKSACYHCWLALLRSLDKKPAVSIEPFRRNTKDEYYLAIAKVVATRSTCLRKQYGAVIVNHDEIIATGYNGSPRGEENCCDRGTCYRESHALPAGKAAAKHGDQYGSCVAVHAEQNAIISASRKDMAGATLYLACLDEEEDPAPCNICDRMIKNAGISKVVTERGAYEYKV